MHSATQEIEDSDMLTFVNMIISLLEDPRQLQSIAACQDAMKKVKQLRDNPLTLLLMRQAEQPLFLQLSSTLATEVERLKYEMTRNTESQQEFKEKIEELESSIARVESYNTVDNNQGIQDMKQCFENLRSSVESQIQKHETSIKQLEDDVLNQSFRWSMSDLDTPEEEDVLRYRNFLIDLYEQEYSEVPIYPLFQDETLSLDELYVPPLIKIDSVLTGIQQTSSKLEASYSYEDILSPSTTTGCSLNRNIYLVGEDGTGKTTFCLQIVRTWCKSHLKNDTGQECSKDEEYLRTFDLLFYIQLRSFCMFGKVEEMIDILMDQNMSDVLRYTNCLVILDGLDEWDPPPDYKPSPFMKYGLPIRSKANRYTILTTTRNWKFEVVRPLKKEITRLVELLGVEEEAAVAIAKTLIDVLNSKSENAPQRIEAFEEEIKRNKLENFMSTPVMLTQLVCLWHDGKSFGNSRCTIYANILDRQLELAQLTKKIRPPTDTGTKLPSCFNEARTCQKYQKVISEISSLASSMLFNNRQSTIVLSQTDVDQWSTDYKNTIDICLKIGLLSQSKVFKKSSERSKRLNFIHKTLQEFLAAVYVYDTDENTNLERVSKMFPSVDFLLEMSTVLSFICGMCPNVGTRLLQIALQNASKDNTIVEYRQNCERFDQNYEIAISIQEVTFEIAKEIAQNEHQGVILPILDLVINRKVLESGLCLSELKPEVIKSIYIDTKGLRKEDVKVLLETLQRLKHLGSIKKLHVCDSLKVIDLQCLFQMSFSSKKTLSCIRFEVVDVSVLNPLYFETLFTVLKLTHLALIDVKLTDEQHELMFKCLSKTTNFQTLYIVNTEMLQRLEICKMQNLRLFKNHRLVKLVLENVNTDNVDINPANLSTCAIILPSPHSVASVVRSLKMGMNLVELSIKPCRNQDVVKALSESVPTLTNLKTIRLSRVDLSKVALELSSDMNNLELVSISYAAFSSSSFEGFVESFPRHHFTFQLECVTVKYKDDYIEVRHYLDSYKSTVSKMRGVNLVMKMGNCFQFYKTDIVLDQSGDA